MITRRPVLLHLCTVDEWQQAQKSGERRPPSLADVGFVHMSSPEQVHLPANRIYQGRTDLVMLWCEPSRLGAEVLWEPGVPGDPESMLFPHLYGPLPISAVTSVTSYLPNADGVFAEVVDQPSGESVT